MADISRSTFDEAAARGLLERAREARGRAYAPYSNFPVGAALLAADGRVFTGVNVENVAYPLGSCAERIAVGKAVSEGAREFVAIAVVGPDDDLPCTPCGGCRQVLHEFAPRIPVVTPAPGGGVRVTPLTEMLPGAFDSERLHHPGTGG
ncbi:MAG TPA: cytidine deaminase [Longimicrobium sp.]